MLWISFIVLTIFGYVNSQLTSQQLDLFRANNVTITNDATEPTKYWIFKHHGVPSHDYGPFPSPGNPNSVTAQDHMFKIPKNPVVASTPGCLRLGSIAAAVNGVPFFNPYSGLGYNAVEGSNREIFDNCTGHPQPQGEYHYHTVPHCLYTGAVDELIGVAYDGYPIYGPKSTGGKMFKSADLDPCHGRMLQNNQYEYRMTMDFPYIIGCYHGEATTIMRNQTGQRPSQGGQPPLGGGPQPGGGPPPGGQPPLGGGPQPGGGPPPGGQPPLVWGPATGGYPPQGGQQSGFPMGDCLYVTFCENPANGCPCSAFTWDPNAPRTSTEICNQTTTTLGSNNNGGGTSAAQCVSGLGVLANVVFAVLFVCLCL